MKSESSKTIWKLRFAQASLIAGLIASVSHLAYSSGAYELNGEGWISWTIAICVELGMLGISLGMADQRRKLSNPKYKPTELDVKSAVTLKRAMMLFAAVNVFGNAYYSFAVILSKPRFLLKDVMNNPDKIDEVTWAAIICFSTIVPALIYVMAELQSIYSLNLVLEKQQEQSDETDSNPTRQKPGPKPGSKRSPKFVEEEVEEVAPPVVQPKLAPGQKIRRKKTIAEVVVKDETSETTQQTQEPEEVTPEPEVQDPDPITGVQIDPNRQRIRVPVADQ